MLILDLDFDVQITFNLNTKTQFFRERLMLTKNAVCRYITLGPT